MEIQSLRPLTRAECKYDVFGKNCLFHPENSSSWSPVNACLSNRLLSPLVDQIPSGQYHRRIMRVVFVFCSMFIHWMALTSDAFSGIGGNIISNNYNYNWAERRKIRLRTQLSAQQTLDPNVYNVDLEKAAELWTVSVQQERRFDRLPGVPFMNSKSKDYYVDDLDAVEISREGGLGLELLELAGGRDDGIGMTVVTAVLEGGNAARAGILPGDTISQVKVVASETTTAASSATVSEEVTNVRVCEIECRDFDSTIQALTEFPGDDAKTLFLGIKRLRRWPKVQLRVEYPPSQCAPGVDNVKMVELFAGENLKLALQSRGFVLDDPGNPKCDFCGSNACYVSIVKGKHLLNPMSSTEEKLLLKNNPNVRLSCKTKVGHNMQEGDVALRLNLSQWRDN